MLAVSTAGLLAVAGTVAVVPASGFVSPSAGWNTARGGSKATTVMAAGIFGKIPPPVFLDPALAQHACSFATEKCSGSLFCLYWI